MSTLVIILVVGVGLLMWFDSQDSRLAIGWKFLTPTLNASWNPITSKYVAWPFIYGTIVTSLVAIIIALPVGLGIAIFLAELSPDWLRNPLGWLIELLAAIPSVVYGLWGIFVFLPVVVYPVGVFLGNTLGQIPGIGIFFKGPIPASGSSRLAAGLILSIMIVPFTASIARDAFNLTPAVVKESAYALGATKWEVVKNVVIPYSKLGVFGGMLFSLGRALGETMAVAFVLGNNHRIFTSLFDSAATITVTLANEFTEADKDVYLSSLFYLALVLFVMSFVFLAIAKFFLLRAERRYSR